jgi:hypothetical protein
MTGEGDASHIGIRANYQNAYARFLKKTAAKTESVGTTGVHLALEVPSAIGAVARIIDDLARRVLDD